MELTSELLQEAKISLHGESFKVIESKKYPRIGVGYRLDEKEFFVELLVKACHGETVDLKYLSEIVENLKKMESMGYSLRCEDDNSLYAEKIVEKTKVEYELNQAIHFWDVTRI